VWPGVFVSESTLNLSVNNIRQALDDDARRPRFIRTAHGFGYAFCGEARDTTDDEPPTAILKEDAPELSATGRAISPGVASIVRRCLEKRVGDHFHSAHDLALALEAAASGLSVPSPERGSLAALA
jgi:hypothetical protein